MGIVVLLLCFSGFCIYKMFRPVFKIFFAVAMVMLIISVGIAAIKDAQGVEDEVTTTAKNESVSEEDVTSDDYLTGVNL